MATARHPDPSGADADFDAAPAGAALAALDALDLRLLDEFQRDFPLAERPWTVLGARLGLDETAVLARLDRLRRLGCIARVGPVFAPKRAGASLLAALAVPPERLDAVADYVSAQPEINHNYAREHAYNLWFVLTAADEAALDAALARIEAATGLAVLRLPLEREYHIDLGFRLGRDAPVRP